MYEDTSGLFMTEKSDSTTPPAPQQTAPVAPQKVLVKHWYWCDVFRQLVVWDLRFAFPKWQDYRSQTALYAATFTGASGPPEKLSLALVYHKRICGKKNLH